MTDSFQHELELLLEETQLRLVTAKNLEFIKNYILTFCNERSRKRPQSYAVLIRVLSCTCEASKICEISKQSTTFDEKFIFSSVHLVNSFANIAFHLEFKTIVRRFRVHRTA